MAGDAEAGTHTFFGYHPFVIRPRQKQLGSVDNVSRFAVEVVGVFSLFIALMTSCTHQEGEETPDALTSGTSSVLPVTEQAAPVPKEMQSQASESLADPDYEWPSGPFVAVAEYDSTDDRAGWMICDGLAYRGIAPIAAGSRGVVVMVSARGAPEARKIVKTLIATYQLNAVVIEEAAPAE